MSAQYQFLPWVRQGAATAYTERDERQPVLARADGKPLTAFPVRLTVNERTPVDVPLRLYGPGDVTGLDPRAVIRTDPPANTADFEPNFLASIEFDTPDLPWLFTPAAAGTDGILRPWLCLVVVERDEADLRPQQDLPPVLVAPAARLPDLAESWAWAHAQALQADASQQVVEILSSLPAQNLSRLVCPRWLEPEKRYLACVVPAFDAGRKAGLGEEVTAEDAGRLKAAWEPGQGRVELPAYYVWEFGTGIGGDFESLAARLQGRPVEDVGRRPLRVEDQPFGLPDAGVLAFEGALVAVRPFARPVVDAAFQERLRAVVNPTDAAAIVAPPVYGRWQSSQAAVPAAGQPPPWLRELNLDPAARAAAGLGVRVVQERQEQLVAAAWEQLGDPHLVAQLERRLEMAVAVLGSVVRRRVQPLEPGRLVQFLGPAQTRMRASAETLRASLARQGLPASFSSAPFRRTLRPAGTRARRALGSTPPPFQRVATRLGRTVPPIGPAAGTSGLVTRARVQGQIGRMPPGSLGAFFRYRQAAAAVQGYVAAFADPAQAPAPDFRLNATFKATLLGGLDPQQTVPRRFYARLTSRGEAVQPPARPGATVVSGPSFPQPMYEALRDLSPELLLPGVGRIDADTVTLLESNPRFIEAYMVGLNHELSAELLWREFPSDLRSTAFRTFWDTRGATGQLAQLPPIHMWAAAASLGDSFSAGQEQLVLLIRGELLQRYPDALIYAVKAATLNTLGTQERLPLFRGRIEPDVTFLGFDLTEDEARGGPGRTGWFFAIQEQPTAPRFGLDVARDKPLASWNDLGWSDLRTVPGTHLKLTDIDVPPAERPPGPVWGRNAAHMAAIMRQRPVRVAFHARRLLPPPPPPPA